MRNAVGTLGHILDSLDLLPWLHKKLTMFLSESLNVFQQPRSSVCLENTSIYEKNVVFITK